MKWYDTKWTIWYFQQCACENAIYFAPVVTTMYRMKNNKGSQPWSECPCKSACAINYTLIHTWAYHMEEISRRLFYMYRNWYYRWNELSGWKGSVSYGLGADLSLPPCLSVTIGIWALAKANHGAKSKGKSFGTTPWHDVQRYCCVGVLFADAQGSSISSRSSPYHIRRNEMNCLWSSESRQFP